MTDIARLVYSPKVWVFVKNANGEILDLTEYVVAGQVKRVINQVSTAEVRLRNPKMIFTRKGKQPPAFHPMDPITIYMERLAGFPVQVFTGYLDETPYLQLFPGTITIKASCTLKRLQFNFFQMAQKYTLEFFNHFGWNVRAAGVLGPSQGGEVTSKQEDKEVEQWKKEEKEKKITKAQFTEKNNARVQNAAKQENALAELESKKQVGQAIPFSNDPNARIGNDGSFSKMLWALLYYIADWKDENIYIEAMPSTVPTLISELWTNFEQNQNKAAKEEIEEFWKGIIGEGAQGSAGPTEPGSATASGNIRNAKQMTETVAKIANEHNVPVELPLMVMFIETGYSNRDTAGSEYHGWFQQSIAPHTPYGNIGINKAPTLAETHDLGQSCALFCQAAAAWVQKDPSLKNDLHSWAEYVQGVKQSIEGGGNQYYLTGWAQAEKEAKALISKYVKNKNQGPRAGGLEGESAEEQQTGNTGSNKPSKPEKKQVGPNSTANLHSPFEKCTGLSSSRTDMGQDYGVTAGQDIVAMADGEKVACVSGWEHGAGVDGASEAGNLHAFHVTEAGPLQGHTYYYAEGVLCTLKIGDKVKGGQVVAKTTSGGADGGHVEFGYCTTAGIPLGQGEFSGANATKAGIEFNRLMLILKPDVPPSTNGDPGKGSFVSGGPEVSPGQGGSSSSSGSGGATGNMQTQATAASFLSQIQYPSAEELAAAQILGGQRSLMNAAPVLNMVQQVCESSLRSFQSLPNGDFFAFYPDYFGEYGHRQPYWDIHDIEILDGEITLSDQNLVTHAFAIGNTTWPADAPLVNEIQAGVMTIFEAFTPGVLRHNSEQKQGTNETNKGNREEAIAFMERYGARPLRQEFPMVYSTLFECLLAFQQWCLAWARQFKTAFTFTFMPELFPGGKVGFPEHGFSMYIESVTHTWDYTDGFHTVAELQAPLAYQTGSTQNTEAVNELPPNMIEGLMEPQRGQVAKNPVKPPEKPSRNKHEYKNKKETEEAEKKFGIGGTQLEKEVGLQANPFNL